MTLADLSGCGEVWYRAWFGTMRPRVQVPPLRPAKYPVELYITRLYGNCFILASIPSIEKATGDIACRDDQGRLLCAVKQIGGLSVGGNSKAEAPALKLAVNRSGDMAGGGVGVCLIELERPGFFVQALFLFVRF